MQQKSKHTQSGPTYSSQPPEGEIMIDLESFKDNGKYTFIQGLQTAMYWWKETTYFCQKKRAATASVSPLAIFFTIIILLIHSLLAWHFECSVTFQRGGADIALVAAALFAFINWYSMEGMVLDGGNVPLFSWLNPNVILSLIALIGTVTWGYGDLMPFGTRGCGCIG